MLKTKILFLLISVLILISVIHFGNMLILPSLYDFIQPRSFSFIFDAINEMVILISLISLSIGLFKIIKKGFFQANSSKYLLVSGVLISISALLDISYSIQEMTKIENPEFLLQRIITNFLLLILGLVALLVSDVLKNGSFIKNENDLTI